MQLRSQKQSKKVLILQLPYQTFSIHDRRQFVIPLVAGYLKSAAYQEGLQKHFDIESLDFISNSFGGDAWIENRVFEKRPDILCVSIYCWNLMRTLYTIEKLKSYLPNMIIVAGGPEVFPDNTNLIRCHHINFFVMRQGERAFIEVLKYLLGKISIEGIEDIFYRKGNKIIINKSNDNALSTKKKEVYPSPYLMGLIDPEILRRRRIMLIEASRGCKFRCKYCSESTRAKKVVYMPPSRLTDEINWAIKNRVSAIQVIDSAFNFSENFKILCTNIASLNKENMINFYNVELRADFIDEKDARLLKKINTKTVEVGLQSINPLALANINRDTYIFKIVKGIKRLMKQRIHVIINLIIGLPDDSLVTFKKACRFLKKYKIYDIPLAFVLQVLPGSQMRKEAKLYGIKYQAKPPYYILKTAKMSQKDISQSAAYFLKLFKKEYESQKDFLEKFKFTLYSSANFPSRTSFSDEIKGKFTSAEELKYPINRLHIDFDSFGEIDDLSFFSKISYKLSTPFTIWFKAEDFKEQEVAISDILKNLSLSNPQILWNVIIESNRNFNVKNFTEIFQSIHYKPHYFDYASIYYSPRTNKRRRSTIRIINIVKGERYKEGLRDLKAESEVYFYWHLSQENQERFKNIFNRAKEEKFLVDFDNSLNIKEIIDILNFIKKYKIEQKVNYSNALFETFSMSDFKLRKARSSLNHELIVKPESWFPDDELVVFYRGANCIDTNFITTQTVRQDLIKFIFKMGVTSRSEIWS